MFKHIVMWKLKPFAEGASGLDNAKIIKERLESLKDIIKTIEHIEVGINCAKSNLSYDIVLYSEFPSRQAFEIYQNHPEHIQVYDFIIKVRETAAIVDYEI